MQAIRIKYIYALLTLVLALYFVPAVAQTKHKAKRSSAKVIKRKPAVKAAARKPVPKVAAKRAVKTNSPQQISIAKNLGDAAAKITVDTVKKSGQNGAGGSLSEEIVVTTAYKPVLADAVKIRINPDLEDKTPFKAPLIYAPLDKRLEQNTDIRPLEAMRRPAERDSALANNYIKVGAGNLKTTYGEAYFNNGKDSSLQYGGFLRHFAQNGNLYKQNSDNGQAAAFIKSIGGVNSINARIDYDYRSNYFYGYNEAGLPPPNFQPGKQHFNTIGGEVELTKNFEDVPNDFTYALKLKGYVFSNALQGKENNLVLSGFLNETVGQFYAGLSGSLDLSTQQDSLYDHNNSLVRVNPYIKLQGDNYKIEAGVNLVDQFGYKSAFYVFPAAKLEYQVIPKYVRLFVEAKGDVNKSSMLDFSKINPYLGQNISIQNSIDQLDISAGLKGTITAGVGFKVAVFRDMVKNMPLFVSDFNTTQGNKFSVIYDGGDTRINGINAEVDIKVSESVDLFGRGEIKDYQMATLPMAWNLPEYKLDAGAVLHISDKIDVNGTLLFRSPAYDPHPVAGGTNPTRINSFADLSGGVTYKASRKIGVFVRLNNILNTTNQTWLYYPDYGFNIFGGISYSF